jgi:hypothetical protein
VQRFYVNLELPEAMALRNRYSTEIIMYLCKKELNSCVIKSTYHIRASSTTSDKIGPIRLSYNLYFSAYFSVRIVIFFKTNQ